MPAAFSRPPMTKSRIDAALGTDAVTRLVVVVLPGAGRWRYPLRGASVQPASGRAGRLESAVHGQQSPPGCPATARSTRPRRRPRQCSPRHDDDARMPSLHLSETARDRADGEVDPLTPHNALSRRTRRCCSSRRRRSPMKWTADLRLHRRPAQSVGDAVRRVGAVRPAPGYGPFRPFAS